MRINNIGAGQSDLYKGTYGDNIRNIPNDAIYGNTSEWISEFHEDTLYGEGNYTDAQRKAINRINNTIGHNLTEKDFSGAERDLLNNPVANFDGGYFDHLQEMRQSLVALKKSAASLEGSLKNPFLTDPEKQMMRDALKSAYEYIKRIEDLFEKYGYGG